MGQKPIIRRDLPLIQRGYEQAFAAHDTGGASSSLVVRFVIVAAAASEEGAPAATSPSSPVVAVLCLSLSSCLGPNDANDDDAAAAAVNRVPHLRSVLWSKKAFCESVPAWVASLVSFPCWVLPYAHLRTSDVIHASGTDNYKWIAKPHSSGGGKGISVLHSERELADVIQSGRKLVIQPFLSNPLLIRGRKVDLRVYVLVTSVAPLRAYVHGRGLVRFASQAYDTSDSSSSTNAAKSQFLTNTSINKKTSNMTAAELTWSFQQLWDDVGADRARQMRLKMDQSIALVLLSVERVFRGKKLTPPSSRLRRYHLLGVDVIFSDQPQDEARVIEVNGEPSFVASDAATVSGEEFAHYDETKIRVQRDVASVALLRGGGREEGTYLSDYRAELAVLGEFRLAYPTALGLLEAAGGGGEFAQRMERALQEPDDGARMQLHHEMCRAELDRFRAGDASDNQHWDWTLAFGSGLTDDG